MPVLRPGTLRVDRHLVTTMKISELLTPELVKLNLVSQTKEDLFVEMVQVFVNAGLVHNAEEALEVLIRREEQMSTGVGNGIGIPHGKLPEATHSLIALGVSRAGIDYDALDDQPVHIVTTIFAQLNNPAQHIEILAEVARLFAIPGFTGKIIAAESPQEVIDLIRAEE